MYAGNVADHYGALGVPPDASLQAIERAYRRTVAQLHPDKHFQDPKKRAQAESDLKRVNQAMHILRDPERRALYDASR
ncbi:MAG: J domain-containing protein [Chloroflexota bacterium]